MTMFDHNMPDSIGRRLIEKYSSEGLQNGTLITTNKINVSRKWNLPDRVKPGPKPSNSSQNHTTENAMEAPPDAFLLNRTTTANSNNSNNASSPIPILILR